MRTVSTRSDTLPSSHTSARVPVSDDEATGGDSTISSGRHEPSARATSSRSSARESTQIRLDSLTSVRSIAPPATPEGFRRSLVEGPDSALRLAEETYHPPYTDDKMHGEIKRGEYDSVYRCVPFTCVFFLQLPAITTVFISFYFSVVANLSL